MSPDIARRTYNHRQRANYIDPSILVEEYRIYFTENGEEIDRFIKNLKRKKISADQKRLRETLSGLRHLVSSHLPPNLIRFQSFIHSFLVLPKRLCNAFAAETPQ